LLALALRAKAEALAYLEARAKQIPFGNDKQKSKSRLYVFRVKLTQVFRAPAKGKDTNEFRVFDVTRESSFRLTPHEL
jgi:hypothetical protein